MFQNCVNTVCWRSECQDKVNIFLQGLPGDRGIPGSAGAPGPKGEDGEPGARGPRGEAGATVGQPAFSSLD